MTTTKKSLHKKISGVNLIGLMISASLGAFILAVIVRVSFTVGDNFQIIKSITELESSARMLTNFFYRVLPNVGFGNSNNIVVHIDSAAGSAEAITGFSFSTDPSIEGIMQCSRRTWPIGSGMQNQTIYFREPLDAFWNNINDLTQGGFITCADATLNIANAENAMPLVSRNQVAGINVVFTVAEVNATNNTIDRIGDVAVNTANATNASPPPSVAPRMATGTAPVAYGVKMSILLRSTDRVFNVNRQSIFNNIFGVGQTYTNVTSGVTPPGDQHLYKLITIAAPFNTTISPINADNHNLLTITQS